MKKTVVYTVLGICLVGLGFVLARVGINTPANLPNASVSPNPAQIMPSPAEKIRVSKIVDGDTIIVGENQAVRLIGIDTPERGDCFFNEAKAATERLVLGKDVKLEKDVSETDRYKRLLKYVWIDNVMLNEQLVNEGYAQVSTYPPDVKYQDRFLKAQQEARDSKRGIWSSDVCGVSMEEKMGLTTNLVGKNDTPGTGNEWQAAKSKVQRV